MKSYELTVLFHPDLEMNLDPALDKVTKVVENAGGKIEKTENDGKKRRFKNFSALALPKFNLVHYQKEKNIVAK